MNKVPKTILKELYNKGYADLREWCINNKDKYLFVSPANTSALRAGTYERGLFYALYWLTKGVAPPAGTTEVSFELYGVVYTHVLGKGMATPMKVPKGSTAPYTTMKSTKGKASKGESKMSKETSEEEINEIVGQLLEQVGKTSYGGGDPEAVAKLEEQHKKVLKKKDKALEEKVRTLAENSVKLTKSMKAEQTLREKLDAALSKPTVSLEPVVSDGTIPNGAITMVSVKKVFPDVAWDKDFEVPVWGWDGVHPKVAARDPNYIFRKEETTKVLYSILTNQRCYLQGHTGSGKTTLITQVAARLNWPVTVINLNSEISQMDLVGKTDITVDSEGKTTTKFTEGVIPQVMQGPNIVVYDELDYIRPDVAYVLQRQFEGNAFTILEDAGRVIEPDPNFRMFATGNTVGQGDEMGMYQGAREQSIAMLDRFTVWGRIDYLNKEEREQLISNAVPLLPSDCLSILGQYITEHLEAFTKSNILQPISPRGYIAVAEAAVGLSKMNNKTPQGNLNEALTMVVLDRCSSMDRAVISEIIQRVAK